VTAQAVGELVTPTGVLVSAAEPETEEWYAARRAGITGTDLPMITGYSRYGNALSVWLDKRGELEDTAGEAARWGQLLEDVVAREWARRNDVDVRPVGVLAHAEEGWRRVSLDRLVDACPDEAGGRCGLEVKTRSAFTAGRYRDDIPDDVLAQVEWGLPVTGLDHMHVAVLLGGQELREFRIDRDEDLEDFLYAAAAPVWEAVRNGYPPAVSPDGDGLLLGLLNKLYEKRSGERHLDPVEAGRWLTAYAAGHDAARAGERLKTQAKTALVRMLDDAEIGLVDERVAFTYRRPAPGPKVTAAGLKRLAVNKPALFDALMDDGYITVSKPGPRFDLKQIDEQTDEGSEA